MFGFSVGFVSWLLLLFKGAFAQFYKIYPAVDIVPNEFPLNSSTIELAAFLALTTSRNESAVLLPTILNVMCIECQMKLINQDPDLLPDTKIEVLYYDTSITNTSKASVAALEYSLTKTHVASLGPDSSDLLLPMVKYLQSLKISNYSPRLLSSTFSSVANFPNLRTITVSDEYMTKNYMQLMAFFGWSWVGAAFADDDIGQSGRYAFAELANQKVYFPCFYIIGAQNNAGLSALASCLQNYTDVQVLLIWGSAGSIINTFNYLYEQTNLTTLTFVINPTAATEIIYEAVKAPPSFYQGTIFLSENYDQEAGFYDCVSEYFVNFDQLKTRFPTNIVDDLFTTLNCTIDTTLPACPANFSERTYPCSCLTDDFKIYIRPYTLTSVVYRDILQSYALALHKIKYNCTALKGKFCDLDTINGEQLLLAVAQNEFVGFSGLITYNITSSTNRLNGTLDVYQLQQAEADIKRPRNVILGFMTPEAVNSYSGIYLDQALFAFKTGGDTVPISIPVPETTDLSSGFWPCFIFALSIVGLVLVVGFFAFMCWKWNSSVVRKAGHLFLLLMLVGVGSIFTANLLWSVQVSIFICIFKGILSWWGGTLICAALFAKAVEYYLIFVNARKRSYEQSGTARVQTFLLSMSVVLANGLLWYLLYLLVAGPILCQSFQSPDDYYYWYTGCLPANTTDDNIYIIMWICLTSAFNLFAVILLAISWDLTSVYGLARSIVFMECNLVVLAITILPLYYALPEYPNYSLQQFLVRSLSSSFAAFFTVLFVFCPLVYSFYSENDDEFEEDPALAGANYDPLVFDQEEQ